MEMCVPKISIVPCTYNSEKYLSKALDSVERQSSGNLARIINASYSSDRIPAILRDYTARNAGRYPIRCIQSEAKDAATALNTDSEVASGELIHYLHSEDYSLDEHALARAARLFHNNPGLVWLTGNFLVEIRGRRFKIPQTLLLRRDAERAFDDEFHFAREHSAAVRQL